MSGARATIGRRRFVQLMGWAGAAAAAQGGPALAAAAKRSKTAARSSPPAPSPSPEPGTSQISEEARALGEVVRRRYGDQLSAQDIETVTRDLEGDLQGIQRLCEAKLANADEPDSIFRA